MITREEFKQYFNEIAGHDFSADGSPLWIPEHDLDSKCTAFIRISAPVKWDIFEQDFITFWEWCKTHLNGQVRCFSSSDDEEWWGFTEPSDIVLWVLKWA